MLDLCKLKQNQGESFVAFLQRWRRLCAKYPRTIPEEERIDIIVRNLVPKLRYEVRKIPFNSFDTMVEVACHIEDVLKEQEILAKSTNNNNSQNNNSNNGNKDKKNYWNKNKQVVNDGVVDSSQPKNEVLNISKSVQAMKLQVSSKQQGSNPKYQGRSKIEKRQFTKLGDSYADIFKTLLAHNLVQPQDPSKFHIPETKPY